MLLLAAFTYWQVRSLLYEAVQEHQRETASDVSQVLQAALEAIDLSLGEMTGVAAEARPTMRSTGGFDAADDLQALLPAAAYVGLRDDAGSIRLLYGAVPDGSVRCADGQTSRLLTFSRDLVVGDGTPVSLEAGIWVSDLLNRRSDGQIYSLAVLEPTDGTLLFSDGCQFVDAGNGSGEGRALRLDPEVMRAGGVLRYRDEEGGKAAAVALVADVGWAVVVTSSLSDVLGPLQRLTGLYWLFVLVLGFSTALAFSMLVGPFTRSLSELARASEEIGLGELDPWLPLHTSGELGQLTTAFSAMLARIRQMMTQVDQSGRLAVVGQLSAYLAHEIRNPLSSIKLNLQRLRRWTRMGDLPEFCLEPLEISLREVDRLNASVTGVLQLSRAEDSPREVVSMHDLVEEAADLLAPKFRRQGVGLGLDLDAEVDRILARIGQVKSAVLNLMVNALEAQPNGGHLEIRSELSHAPEMGGPVIALHFRDSGPGVPAEIRDRIFEPFFTTKPGGSGIGLAMASQSVRASGGELLLEPSFMMDGGSDFVALFPLAALEVSTESSRRSSNSRNPPARKPLSPGVPGAMDTRAMPAADPGGDEGDLEPRRSGVPTHLLTPEGLRAVLALSRPDSEDVH